MDNKRSLILAGIIFLLVIAMIIFIFIYTSNSMKTLNENSPCKINNYSCYDSCPGEYERIDLDCGLGICCKKVDQRLYLLYGYVQLKEGNCMPPVDKKLCIVSPLITQIAIFPKINSSEFVNNYYVSDIGPVKMTLSNADDLTGYYKVSIEPGVYSVLAKDPKQDNNFYCNSFDEECACCVNFTQEQRFDILIDRSTQ